MIYQLRKLNQGIEQNNDSEYEKAYMSYPIIKKTFNKIPITENYVIVTNEESGLCTVKVVKGPMLGKHFKVSYDLLKKPNLLPCFCNKDEVWLTCVNQIENSELPKEVEQLINNAVSKKRITVITAGFSDTSSTKDSVLSIQTIEEVLKPYLGPFGLLMMLKLLKERVFNE